jgi:hypothetical protein
MASRKSPLGWVRPLPLALEAAGDGVVALGLLAEAHLLERRVADHQVAGDQRHLDRLLPLAVELLAAALGGRRVEVLALGAVLLHPGQRLLVLGLVIDALVHAADELRHVDGLDAHAEVFLEERLVHDGAGDAHGDAAHAEVRLAAHGGHGQAGAGEAQDLLRHVLRDGVVAAVLDVAAVDAERGQALLGVAGQHGRQVHRTRALGAVEAPDRLRAQGVHVHGLAAVAPAGGDGEGQAHVLAGKLVGAGGGLGDAADAGVGDHALDGSAGGVAQRGADQLGRGLGQGHGLLFERLAHAAQAAVDGGADTDPRQVVEHVGTLHAYSFVGCGAGLNKRAAGQGAGAGATGIRSVQICFFSAASGSGSWQASVCFHQRRVTGSSPTPAISFAKSSPT